MSDGTDRTSLEERRRGLASVDLERAAERLADEFAGVFNRETVERLLHDSVASLGAGTVQSFVPLLAERFARERLGALARTERKVATTMPSVLFLCTHNAGRSQMAAGWLKHLSGGRALVYSGGSEPGNEVNPVAIEAMAEVGIDIAGEYPKPWTDEVIRSVDVVVTMGCGDACPVFPGIRYVDWEVEDPAGQGLGAVRRIRDDVEQRVRSLLGELGVAAE
ncbi:MAG: arsenate reductase ArsC [Dehalococcoidia bacterium]|nr:arsenate reductase ArsC [Dehalococcoidia bacterium]